MVAEVIVDILTDELDRVFDYECDDSVTLGCRVLVPFGNRKVEGYVIGLKSASDRDIKPIIKCLDEYPAIIPEMLDLMRFMVDRYHVRLMDALRLFVPNKLRGGKVKPQFSRICRLNDAMSVEDMISSLKKGANAQIGCIKELEQAGSMDMSVLNARYRGAVRLLIDKGYVLVDSVEKNREPIANLIADKDVVLKPSQQRAYEEFISGERAEYLLHGVTGSGKTEVYMHTIRHYLDLGKNAIMLVPEISLTPQILGLFRSRFGTDVAILHSGLSDGERYDEWRRIITGKARIVVGARSAIFAPIKNIGVIIIDEEHDSSYVSESNPRYTTIEVARFRREKNNAVLISGSATPDITRYAEALSGQIRLVEMKERVNGKVLPKMEIVDMSRELRLGNTGVFSVSMKEALRECIDSGNQAMIFINRRGYASFMMCRKCGYVAKCMDCDVSLTYHSTEEMLKCHYCGKRYRALTNCPECGSEEIRQGRTGTEKVVEELKCMFPSVSILRMDNDTVSGKDSHGRILGDFREKKAQILVGTQMIAKGHDFPSVTLVGILDADLSLYMSDYRSSERTYQLVTQVAGRAGRDSLAGRVILQTYAPKHYVFRYAQDYDYLGFYKKESNSRQVSMYPPYTTIVRVLVSSQDDQKSMDVSRNLYREIKLMENISPDLFVYLGAMRSPVKRIQKRYRYQILMRLTNVGYTKILRDIYALVDNLKEKDVNVFVETNPTNLN